MNKIYLKPELYIYDMMMERLLEDSDPLGKQTGGGGGYSKSINIVDFSSESSDDW